MSDDALFQLGMDLTAHADDASCVIEPRSITQTEDPKPGTIATNDRLDHFIEKDGVRCAGSHLIIDLYDAERLDDLPFIEETLKACVNDAGATLLHIHLHPFEPTGVSGVAVLAESHISVHTWPEVGYAAFDVFMCGNADPTKCVERLKRAFRPGHAEVSELLRGSNVA